MDNQYLVSIILPVFNGEEYLSASIESCLNQSYPSIELIIVNDASTDSSLKIANNYASKDARVKVISNPTNKNLPSSLNIGHKAAKGKFISWTSHDNYYEPFAIEKMVYEILLTKADIIFSDFVIIDSADRRIGRYNFKPKSSIVLENTVRACFLYEQSVFERNEGYNENLFKIEDYDFWLRASRHSVFRHLPEELYYYRSHSKSLTANKTISQFVYQKDYIENVEKMYSNFLQECGFINRKLSETLKNLHLNQRLDVSSFLTDYINFKEDLNKLIKEDERSDFWREVDKKLRSNLIRFPQPRNIFFFYKIMRIRPQLLLFYSKRKSIRIISKILLKPRFQY